MNDLSLSAAAAVTALPPSAPLDAPPEIGFDAPLGTARFADWLVDGVQGLNQRLASANALAAQFALGADLPPHQVVLALEEARLSFQLAMQVRARLLEGYQELMRMQL